MSLMAALPCDSEKGFYCTEGDIVWPIKWWMHLDLSKKYSKSAITS